MASAAPIPSAGPGVGDLLQAAGALVLLLAILFAALWLLRRYGSRAGLPMFARGDLALEGQLALGPGRSVAVVRYHGRRLVLGVTERSITLLTEDGAPGGEPAGGADFEQSLAKAGREGSADG